MLEHMTRRPPIGTFFSILALVVASGCRMDDSGTTDAIFEVRAGAMTGGDGWRRTDLVVGGSRVWMSDEVAVDESMVRRAEATLDDQGRPAVLVELDEEGAYGMRRLSLEQLSRPIVVLVDGRPSSAPIVMSPLGGRFMIAAADLTVDEAEALARRLSAD